jgi:hypothetical protein
MTIFTWRDELTITVNEMSRAQALDCARQFDLLARVYTSYDDLMQETDVLGAMNAPAVIKIKDDVFIAGERAIALADGTTLHLALPLTRECFNALPMSLTQAWVSAMLDSNNWLIDSLKKAFSLAAVTASEPQSGNAPSSELSQTVLPTMTTGE